MGDRDVPEFVKNLQAGDEIMVFLFNDSAAYNAVVQKDREFDDPLFPIHILPKSRLGITIKYETPRSTGPNSNLGIIQDHLSFENYNDQTSMWGWIAYEVIKK